MKSMKIRMALVLSVALGAGCGVTRFDSSEAQRRQTDPNSIPTLYNTRTGLKISPNDLYTADEMIRVALESSYYGSTAYCLDIRKARAFGIRCAFQKWDVTNGLSIVRFRLSRDDWNSIAAIVHNHRLMEVSSSIKPICIGRPYDLAVELRIGGQYHFIARDCPHDWHDQRDMTGIIELCRVIIQSASIPEQDKWDLRRFLGIPPPEDKPPNEAAI